VVSWPPWRSGWTGDVPDPGGRSRHDGAPSPRETNPGRCHVPSATYGRIRRGRTTDVPHGCPFSPAVAVGVPGRVPRYRFACRELGQCAGPAIAPGPTRPNEGAPACAARRQGVTEVAGGLPRGVAGRKHLLDYEVPSSSTADLNPGYGHHPGPLREPAQVPPPPLRLDLLLCPAPAWPAP